MKSYTEIEAGELIDLIGKNKVMLVDVRNDDEVAHGVISGATHMKLSMLPLHYEKLLKASTVVFYCHSGIRSAHAADFAVGKGVRNVYNLAGGVVAWNRAGYALSSKTNWWAACPEWKIMEFDKEVDARNLKCPLPILRCKKGLSEIEADQTLKITATDPGAVKDFEAFCKQTGHVLTQRDEEDDLFIFYIKKRSD